MSHIAIRVEKLGKQYRIGQLERYKALRDTLTDVISTPFRAAVSLVRGRGLRNGNSPSERKIWALRDVSFEVQHGEILGIIGRNGAGKSTLLKILSRITEPTEGSIDIYGRVGSLLEVGTGFHPELTGRENIFLNGAILGMRRAEIIRKFDEIVDFAEIEKFIDTPTKFYSSGMYMRLAFSVAAHLEPDILLVDEVLAVGDIAFQKKCLGKMGDVANEGRTVLFISHNMAAIERLCTKVLFLEQGRIIPTASMREAIAIYIGSVKENEKMYESGPLRSASVHQEEQRIVISAEYVLDHEIALPCLGFVISDHLGNYICGSNPKMESIQPSSKPKRKGKVRVTLSQPLLLNGTYRVSLWFGDGQEDFFNDLDALSFEAVNMSSLSQVSSQSVGPVAPVCEWLFE
jgi:lipopolysaccharide transport system ATP-binding protein